MSGPALPSSDRIVYVVWRRGDVQAAAQYASAAIARSDRDTDPLRVQLSQMRAREPLVAPSAPLPELDEALCAGLVERFRYYEARIVLVAGGLLESVIGRRLQLVIDEVLAPFPDEADASFAAVLHLIRAGQAASALRAIDEVVRQSPDPPSWLVKRQRGLALLVRGGWREGPAPVEEMTRETVLARIRARDIVGALEAAKRADAPELAAVLARLVSSTERVFAESPPDADDPETMPMEGHRLCEFQIRMGVLDQADRGYRTILRLHPDDDRARVLLADVIALRQALGETVEPMPVKSASVSWLSKKAPRTSTGWSAGAPPHRRFEDEPVEESTDVLEASQEAELLLKLGKAQQALDMYRIVAIRHPRQQAYRKRIAEIEALIAQRGVPTSAEVTLKHDLSHLQSKAVPTSPAVKLPDAKHPRFSEEEDWPTVIDRVPDLGGDTEPE